MDPISGGRFRACSKITTTECIDAKRERRGIEQALSLCFNRQLCRRANALIYRRSDIVIASAALTNSYDSTGV